MSLRQRFRWFLWNRWKRVALTEVGAFCVSTVAIYVPGMKLPDDYPRYETMVFTPDGEDAIERRYQTRSEARKGHWKIVRKLTQLQMGG